MTEEERQEWNAAVAAGDEGTIERLRDEHLVRIHTRIMNDDPRYAAAGWRG